MTPEQLSQWRQDAVLMREFLRSPEWAAFSRHLTALHDDALGQEDLQSPTDVDMVMHYRAGRLAFKHVLALPDRIIARAAAEEAAAAQADASKERVAKKGLRKW